MEFIYYVLNDYPTKVYEPTSSQYVYKLGTSFDIRAKLQGDYIESLCVYNEGYEIMSNEISVRLMIALLSTLKNLC